MGILRRPLSRRSEGKGRNGYFWATRVEADLEGVPPRLRLEVFSKRAGESAPLVLLLDAQDAVAIEAILRDFIAGVRW